MSRQETGREPMFAVGRHDTFDLMTDVEFHMAFMRISYAVDFKGVRTPDGIDSRIKEEASTLRILGERGYFREESAHHKADNLRKIAGTSFATRTISTAKRHPQGLENLTLNFGREKAIDILIERNIRLRRMTRMEHPSMRKARIGTTRR
jgi:hypothetical protein